MMTHNELCKIGGKWLKEKCHERCPIVVTELRSYSAEIPDVFGTNSSNTVIVEVKVSRSDFLRDAKKPWRQFPETGIGDFRYYLCPAGLIKPEEVPEKWGLLWVDESGKVEAVKDVFRGNINAHNTNRFPKHRKAEVDIMYSILRRLFQKKSTIREFENFI